MAKTTLRVRVAELLAENENLRRLCADWAHQSTTDKRTILKLKSELTAARAAHMPDTRVVHVRSAATENWNRIRELSIAYCRLHGVTSCTREQALSMAMPA